MACFTAGMYKKALCTLTYFIFKGYLYKLYKLYVVKYLW